MPQLDNPYRNYRYWYKGQIHAHSIHSDGDQSPYAVENAYQRKGYRFIVLTDHNRSTPDPEVIGILHITGAEDGDAKRHHLLALGIDFDAVRQYRQIDSGRDSDQDGIDDSGTQDCGRVQKRIDYLTQVQHAAAVLAHPTDSHGYWGGGYTLDELRNLSRYTGIEVYSGSGHLAETWWDTVLRRGVYKQVWGFGSDDCHDVRDNHKDFNRNWIVVNSEKNPRDYLEGTGSTPEREEELRQDLLENIKEGNFYFVARSPGEDGTTPGDGPTDQGPRLRVRSFFWGHAIGVYTDRPSTIEFLGAPTGRATRVLRKVEGKKSAAYAPTPLDEYVRVRITQRRPDENGETFQAFSQPLFVRRYISLEAFAAPHHYIRHKNYRCEMMHLDFQRLLYPTVDRKTAEFIRVFALKDSTFRMLQGGLLESSDPNHLSFEAVNWPGWYLRHQDYQLRLAKREDSELFRHDATFKIVEGLASKSGRSMEATNFADHFIVQTDDGLRLEARQATAEYRDRATFRFVDPLFRGLCL